MVLGPAPTLARVSRLIEGEDTIDAAVLDANLGGHTSYPATDCLAERRVPFLFMTGYSPADLPERYAQARHFQKPLHMRKLVRALAEMLASH